MKPTPLLIGLISFSVVGCGEAESTKPAASPAVPAVPAVAAAPAAKKEVYKPEYTLDVKVSDKDPKQYTVVWTAKVNTGGWAFKTDKVLVEDVSGLMTARIYATLESPNPNDMVTQALTVVSDQFDAADKKIEAAELSVRQQVKDVKSDWPAMYSVVKTAKLAK